MSLSLGPKGLILLLGLFLASGGSMALAEDNNQGSDHEHSSSGGSEGGSGDHEDHGTKTESHDGGSGHVGSTGGDDNETEDHNDHGGVGGVGNVGSVQNLHELNESPEKEQEEARQAVATGKAAPLTKLLEKLKTDYPGQILDVALLRAPNKLKFSVKYIDVAGVVKTVTLDAVTLRDE